jgi:hypothetical protein
MVVLPGRRSWGHPFGGFAVDQATGGCILTAHRSGLIPAPRPRPVSLGGSRGPGPVCATGLAAVAAPIGFDGIYRGTSTLTRGDDPPCGKTPAPATLSVVNGQFNLVWDAVRHFGVNLVVQQDGSFSGSQMYMPTARAPAQHGPPKACPAITAEGHRTHHGQHAGRAR